MDRVANEIAEALGGDLLPSQNQRELTLLYALLATTVGTAVNARHVHDAWTVWMAGRGESHASMVPFSALDEATQAEDEPYVRAIRQVASRLEDA